MDKRVGSSAGLFALVTLVLHSFGVYGGGEKDVAVTTAPEKKEEAKAKKPSEDEKTKKPADDEKSKKSDEFDGQGPWLATQALFGKEFPDTSDHCLAYLLDLSNDCSPADLLANFGLQDPKISFEFLIATVPDPLHTRLVVETDRTLDSIQRAAFDSDWELATQWLPWKAVIQSNAEMGSAKEQILEHLPGILTFRHHFTDVASSNQILIVFTIGETPTAGLNRFQFDFAKRFVSKVQDPGTPVRIAGPTYSGSFWSLTELVNAWPVLAPFTVYSGTAVNDRYAKSMLAKSGRRVNFHGYSPSSFVTEGLFEKLAQRLKVKGREIALISEGETGYAFSFGERKDLGERKDPNKPKKASKDRVTEYSFPREIAYVRNRFNDAAFINPMSRGRRSPSQNVDFSLKDTLVGEDSFPIFSANHTPASLNAMLQELTQNLKQNGVRLASLAATNEFDAIFLANVFKKQCPDMRLVVDTPDLLFNEGVSNSSLSGLLTFSLFPPPELEVWPSEKQPRIDTFASGFQRGEYLSILSLLNEEGVPSLPKNFGKEAWILELGASSWRAIDVVRLRESSWFMPADNKSSGRPDLPRPTLVWTACCALAGVFTIGFCSRFIRRQRNANAWPTAGMDEAVYYRYLCLLGCVMWLALINAFLLCPMAAGDFNWGNQFDVIDRLVEGTVVIALLSALAAFLFFAFKLPKRIASGGSCVFASPASRCIRILMGAFALTSLAFWLYCCIDSSPNYWRAISFVRAV